MNRGTNLGEQHAHERELAEIAHLVDLLTQTAKSLGILNGGAAVAMLGLIQALAQRELQFVCFKAYGLASLGIFVAGALAAALTFLARWQRSVWLLVEQTYKQRAFWMWVTFALFAMSSVAFVVGAVVTGLGLARL
ncbi:hypothetical protein [Paraburkholderia caribensis]|uniref:hypothetical protein n=1 Tax=Paraburkholderia caribensis TaxID=75105 RepID=UPI0028619163|nr:hypothetical protein [Paraburkholderia caribensis]MDR6381775.1 uncharacterized membrane protein YidH (DUF202 family) [Paraburkholderia caribensis]